MIIDGEAYYVTQPLAGVELGLFSWRDRLVKQVGTRWS